MKNNFLLEFIEKSKNNHKIAFIYKKGLKYKKVSFHEFLIDIYKMNSFIRKNVNGNNLLIFSFPYSYLFFVTVFACVFSGKNLVIIDSFGDRKKIKKMLELAKVDEILVDNITEKLKFLLPNKINNKKISKRLVSNFTKEKPFELVTDKAKITTFTSGTTGLPKIINRNIEFLENQMELIKNNAEIFPQDITYALLPMYSLLSVLMNNTCLVSKNISICKKFNATMLLTSIKKIQKIKFPLKTIKRAFIGGAILYKNEVEEILHKLPEAKITYIYGASEGAVIYKTTLKEYSNNLFTFDTKSSGINVEIVKSDANGVGEIVISGKTVIGNEGVHYTGDLGKLDNNKLILLGRKKYSCSEISFYNYAFDEKIRKENSKVKSAFSFYYENKIHVAYTGKIQKEKNRLADLERKLEMIINDAELKLEEDSAFEKLLKVLVDYGMDEEKAAQMIADCIDEQYELDEISTKFIISNIYKIR